MLAIISILFVLVTSGCASHPVYMPQPPSSPTPNPTPSPPISAPPCLTAKEAWNNIGKVACVEFYVGGPYRSSKGNIFLNELSDYKKGVTAVIMAGIAGKFGDPIAKYGYKTVRVTGLIKLYEGHPEIMVNSPSDITVVK